MSPKQATCRQICYVNIHIASHDFVTWISDVVIN